MKRALFGIAVLLVCLIAIPSLAVNSQSTKVCVGNLCYKVVSFDSADDTCAPIVVNENIDGWVFAVETVPDSEAAPTADWDATITDASGIDIMGGALADRSTSATEMARPELPDSTPVERPTLGVLTVNVTNAGDGAGTIKIWWKTPERVY